MMKHKPHIISCSYVFPAHRSIADGGAVKRVRIHTRDKVLRGRQAHGAIRVEQRVDLAVATPL
jgi:hypothetical protein